MPSRCVAKPWVSSTVADSPTTGCGCRGLTMGHRNRLVRYKSPPSAVPSRPRLGLRDPGVRTLLVTGHTGFVGRAVRGVLQASPDRLRWRLATLPDGFDVR